MTSRKVERIKVPNHVDFDLIVTGDADSLKEFEEFAKEKYPDDSGEMLLSANKFLPYPEEYRKLDEEAKIQRKNGVFAVKDGFNSGGYDWCVKNWGTKWGIYDAEMKIHSLKKKNAKLKYRAQSAWSPPSPVIVAMSKKFPTLTFQMFYYERGMAFKGVLEVLAGEILKDESSEYRGKRGG